MPTITETATTSPIGRQTPRIDGPFKVSGTAMYASDFNFPGLLYAVPVEATIANGKLHKLDMSEAEKMPGVRAIFTKDKPNVNLDLQPENEPETVETTHGRLKRLQSERGDTDKAFASAQVKVDQTYVTPAETHNPIELQGTIAMWDGQMLTIYEESQAVFNLRSVLAQMFGLPKENVRVITKFVGSGFGSKLWPWTHCP